MAKLIITRKSKFFNWSKDYKIFLNGEKIGTISCGKTEEFIIPEGTGILKVKIDWCGSPELKININDKETKTISLSGFKFEKFLTMLMGLGILSSLLFREFIRNHSFLKYPIMILLVILALTLIYYLTIGRNKFIAINENPCQTE